MTEADTKHVELSTKLPRRKGKGFSIAGLVLAIVSFGPMCPFWILAFPALVLCMLGVVRKSAIVVSLIGLIFSFASIILISPLPCMEYLLPTPLAQVRFQFGMSRDFDFLLHVDGFRRTRIFNYYYGVGGSEGYLEFKREVPAKPEAVKKEMTRLVMAHGWSMREFKPEGKDADYMVVYKNQELFNRLKRGYDGAGWGLLTREIAQNDVYFEKPLKPGEEPIIRMMAHIFSDGRTVGFFCQIP